MDASPSRTRRLITQNLIVSSMTAERADSPLDWHHIEDLAALVDVYCLCDEAHVLARMSNVLDGSSSGIAELMSDFVTVDHISGSPAKRIAAAAEAHLKIYTSAGRLVDVDPNLQLYTSYASDEYDLIDTWSPDYREQRYLPAEEDYEIWKLQSYLNRSTTYRYGFPSFVGRSFLYLAYSDVNALPFTPDSRRAEILRRDLQPEERLSGELAAILRSQYSECGGSGFKEVRTRVSPLAAVVFERTNGRRELIAREMVRLRDELADLRRRLASHEHNMLFGSFAEAQRAQRRWQAAFGELRKAYGLEPVVLDILRALKFSENIAEIADKPTKTTSWVSALLALPIEAVSRLMARRPLIEIHRLRQHVPAGGRLHHAIQALFNVA